MPLALLLPAHGLEARAGAERDFETTLRRAETRREVSFRLEALCPDQQIVRELQLLSSGVAIWNRRTQLQVPPTIRSELLGDLLQGGFLDLDPRYGGREDPGRPEAAVRITCRIAIGLEGLTRSSVQLAEGRQSAELASLANALLDRVQPLVTSGVTPDDLSDGLDRLTTGELAPELLWLRWVRLPSSPDEGPGAILRIVEGNLFRRSYTPGREIGEIEERSLNDEQIQALAREWGRLDFQEMPINLWSDHPMEIEIGVLGHRKTVLARPFRNLESDRDDQAQARLEKLLEGLRALESELSRETSSRP